MYRKILVFSFFLCLMARCAAAVGYHQEMAVKIGVFDAAHITFDYAEKGLAYRISADVSTTNLFNTLYPFLGRYEGIGKKDNSQIIPAMYLTTAKTRSHLRTKKILYNEKGQAYQRVSTKDGKESVAAIVNTAKNMQVADLQTVFAGLINRFKNKRGCAYQQEVYDGKKHYKVVVKDEGTENRRFELLGRTELAYKCSLYIENLKDNNDNILWEVSAERPINFWIGLDQKINLPYLLEIGIDSTPLGALKVIPLKMDIKE